MPFENIIYFSKNPGSYMTMGSISKAIGVVGCVSLHLQEGDALWK